MTETQENMKIAEYSKLTRIVMVVVSMLLIFGGPTYVPYLMFKLNIDYTASVVVGAVLFIVGIIFMIFLIRKKVITP